MAKPKKTEGKIKPDQFLVWVTMPKNRRTSLRSAAASLDMPMSKFARMAVEEAIRCVESGRQPFTETNNG